MIRGDFLFFFLFLFFSPTHTHTLLLDLLFSKRDIICCICNFFFFFGGGRRAVYMWILIRDHGRLRVPRQAKFLSCKYWGVYLGHKLITATLGRALIRLWGFASSVVC